MSASRPPGQELADIGFQDDGSSAGPVWMPPLKSLVEAYFDFDQDGSPSPKQWAAWEQFCDLAHPDCQSQLTRVLKELARRLPPSDPNAAVLAAAPQQLRTMPEGIWADLVIVPHQDKAEHRFVIVALAIDLGEETEFDLELEVLFVDGRALFAGEFSGLHARLDWHWFNSADFVPEQATHPYQ